MRLDFRHIAGILLICLPSCEHENALESVVPDEFSGRVVSGPEIAREVILSRFDHVPLVGDPAPETRLVDPVTLGEVRLADLTGGTPAVLIFGSWTCPSTVLYAEEYERLIQSFGEKVNFYFIYIREAHPKDGFQTSFGSELAEVKIPLIADPVEIEKRCELAVRFRAKHASSLRCFVDGVDDSAATIWGAWPSRIFVIGVDGKVIYSGGQGPWYYRPTREGWHDPPPKPIENVLTSRPFSRGSLEEFLAKMVPVKTT